MKEILRYIQSDHYRTGGGTKLSRILKTYLKHRIFRVIVWYRITHYCFEHRKTLLKKFANAIYKRKSRKCGIEIPAITQIGYGIRIEHGYGLVINSDTKIGNNPTFTHNVTFALEKGYAPKIGNQVRFTPGVVVVGKVKIGDNSVIGANCVVNKDVPENNVAVGIPNKNLERPYADDANRFYWECKS